MDKAAIFTFKQRVEELTKALKRKATEERQHQLDELKEILRRLEKQE